MRTKHFHLLETPAQHLKATERGESLRLNASNTDIYETRQGYSNPSQCECNRISIEIQLTIVQHFNIYDDGIKHTPFIFE